MSDSLLHADGPEGRNQKAAAFEDQLAALGSDLGWDLVFRNIDFYLGASGGQSPSRGYDLVWSVADPRDGQNYGWVQEAKRHDGMGRYSQAAVHEEVHVLAAKVARARDLPRFRNHREVQRRGLRLVGGLLTHRTPGFQPSKMASRLQDMQLAGKQGGVSPVRVGFIGPDTLNGFAEAFDRFGRPDAFLWPPSLRRGGDARWGPSAPPGQVAAGMVAWRTAANESVLWLRQGLHHDDLDALSEITYQWGLNPDHVLFTELRAEELRLVGAAWEQLSTQTNGRSSGRLPASPTALDITCERLNVFDKLWPATS